jgi:hypothetical protein
MDRVGRKPLMMTAFAGCCACLIIEAAVIASFVSPVPAVPNVAGLRMGVAALSVPISRISSQCRQVNKIGPVK